MMPRYPQIRVNVRSHNPLTAISAIREALRQAGVSQSEIARFSHQAFACCDLESLREHCRSWVRVEAPRWSPPPQANFACWWDACSGNATV